MLKEKEHPIATRRKQLDISQHQLAVLSGLSSQAYVSFLEHRRRIATQPTLERLAKALRCKTEDLIED